MKMDASTLDTDSNSNDNASTRVEENKDYCEEYCMCAVLSSN
jgi:hypothetical protein